MEWRYQVEVDNKTLKIKAINSSDKWLIDAFSGYTLTLYNYQTRVESHWPVLPPEVRCNKVTYPDDEEVNPWESANYKIDLEVPFGPLSSGRYYLRIASVLR